MIRIGVDLAGSEQGPAEVVAGAKSALEAGGMEITLVGPRPFPDGTPPPGLRFVETEFAIPMGDKVNRDLLRRPGSSLFQLVRMAREGAVDAVLSGGNTACFVALATSLLDTVPGVDRPGIALTLPKMSGATILIDVGANTAAVAEHLAAYGVMGASLFEALFETAGPSVGLLSVGHEESKGSDLTRKAHAMLKDRPDVNFIGNIEGHDIFSDRVDVAVTDGFTGNCLLKSLEGMVEFVSSFIAARFAEKNFSAGSEAGTLLREQFRRLEFSEHSGGFLMGVNGVCVIIHGRSGADAHRTAIIRARDAVSRNLVGRLKSGL